jgi:hypothetical protein
MTIPFVGVSVGVGVGQIVRPKSVTALPIAVMGPVVKRPAGAGVSLRRRMQHGPVMPAT